MLRVCVSRQLDCEALKVQLEKQLSEKDESHKKELAKTVEMFRKQLTEKEEMGFPQADYQKLVSTD